MKIAYNPITESALTDVSSFNQDIVFDLSGKCIYARGIKFEGTDTIYTLPNAGSSSKPVYVTGNTPTQVSSIDNTLISKSAGTSTLSWNTEVTLATIAGQAIKAKLPANPNVDTKTASSNNTDTKLFLVGAESQSTSGQTTYSNKLCYIGTDNCLYSNDEKVLTSVPSEYITNTELINKNYLTSIYAATSDVIGGIKIGYKQSNKNYPVELDTNDRAFVNVPWITYSAGTNVSISNGVISATDTTYSNATTSKSGLMSAADKVKLDSISATDVTNFIPLSGSSNITGNLTPKNNNCQLGTSDYRWNVIYGNNMYAKAFYQSSDKILKENIQELSKEILEEVYNIKEVSFNWKDSKERSVGYIAQDYENISNIFVYKNENGILSLNYIQVLVAQISALKFKISELEQKLK